MRSLIASSLLFLGAVHSFAQEKNPRPDLPLPGTAKQGGTAFVDLSGDGHLDLVVSNPQSYGVYLFVPKERAKKNLEWHEGWSQVMREGKAGDASSIPLIVDAGGKETGVKFGDGQMTAARDGKTVAIPFAELLQIPGPPPMPPRESLAAMQLKPGYTAELAAHEPQVMDPVWIDWDARGRLWVVEMGDYPFAEGEKTSDGRVGQSARSALMMGRIKILEDPDGDGFFDKATLFLDGLKHPTGLALWRGGVFIACIPDILFAEDTDGDGKCDKQEPWITGFTAGNPQHLVNGFCWGLDGWLHGANGDSGGYLESRKTGQKVKLGTNDFRFHPDTGELRLESGRTQYGKWRDDWGNWFGNNNSTIAWHYWLPMSLLEKNQALAVASLREVTNQEKRVFPISPPVRRWNQQASAGQLTSGCNAMPFRDTTFGSDGQDVLFICEPANNLVHREALDYSVTPITSHRHPGDKDSEFIASRDNWFRPTMARTGPDGALYVVDFYRLVLEHPEWIPAEMCQHMDLRAGEDQGRIYRIKKAGRSSRSPESDPVKALQSPNGQVRDTAQRLLLEKAGQPSRLTGLMSELEARSTLAPHIQLQVLFTARLLGQITAAELFTQAKALSPRIRGTALAAANPDAEQPLTASEAAWLDQVRAGRHTKPIAAVPTITNQNPDRQKIVAKYNQEVAKLTGEAKRGEAVFQKACIACHRSHNQGIEVGPDLGTVAAKPDEQLIEAIFDPNRAVEQRNAATQVTKKDGSAILGLLVTETPGNIALRLPGGVELVILRSDIKETKTLTTSLMLEGLEAAVTPQECADLLRWIRE